MSHTTLLNSVLLFLLILSRALATRVSEYPLLLELPFKKPSIRASEFDFSSMITQIHSKLFSRV